MREHTDYFGRKVEVGDKIIRAVNGCLEEREVVGTTNFSLKLKRKFHHEINSITWKYCEKINKFIKHEKNLSKKPIYWTNLDKSFIIL